MNNESYYQRKQAFLNSDPEFVQLKEQRSDLYKIIRKQKGKASTEIFGIAKTMRAVDACMSFAMESENSGENDQETQDAILNRFTGECSECWTSTWHSSADHLIQSAIDKCTDVAGINIDIKRLNKEADDLSDLIEKAEKVLTKTFNELEEKNKKEAKKNG
tara:strand:+ start:64 stop:546 length:483 start_codon:yes stop_codon:yes gene_type:complete